MNRDVECRGAPRHQAFEPRDVSAHVLEDASRDFSRAMGPEMISHEEFGAFPRSNRAPLGSHIDTLRRRFDGGTMGWSRIVRVDST